MPTNDFILNLLEIKDLIVTNISSDPENIHISFYLQRKDHVRPNCGAITNKVHDYRPSIIKDSSIMGRKTSFIIKKDVIIAIPVVNILTNPSLCFQNIAGLPIALDSLLFTF